MCGVRIQVLFLLIVCLELKSFADDDRIVRPVTIVPDAITLVLVLRDATILVIALHSLMIEVDLQTVIGVAFELHGTTVAMQGVFLFY